MHVKKCAPQTYNAGGGGQGDPKSGGWVSSKIPPPPLLNAACLAGASTACPTPQNHV